MEQKMINSYNGLPDGLNEFYSNMMISSNGDIQHHNLYLIQTTDTNGNITDEAYGINLLTNLGLRKLYTSSGDSVKRYIFTGIGTDTPSVTNYSMFSAKPTSSLTTTSDDETTYPVTFDSTNNIIIGREKIITGYLDYNLTGVTEAFDITEVGVGSSSTALISHTRIYDVNGNLSNITKNINERLTISVFWTANINASIINTAYTNGHYVLIDPSVFIQKYNSSFIVYGGLFASRKANYDGTHDDNYSIGYSNIFSSTGVLENNDVTASQTFNDKLISTTTHYIDSCIFSDKSIDYGNIGLFAVLNYENLSTSETLTSDIVYTNSIDSNEIDSSFGRYLDEDYNIGILPCVNFNVSSSYMYNYLTDAWDIQDVVVNPTVNYSESLYFYLSFLTTFNSITKTYKVFVNTQNTIPISSFDNSGVVLYATDTYWDTSTWTVISNLTSIDSTLGTKKYYIASTDVSGDKLKPVRNRTVHSITPVKSAYELSFPYTAKNDDDSKKILTNDTKGWVWVFDHIVFPNEDDGPIGYQLLLPSTVDCGIWRYSTDAGDRIMSIGNSYSYASSSKTLRIYTITDSTTTPTYVDIALDTYSIGFQHYSFSGNGYFISQQISSNNAMIVDVYNATQITLSDVSFTYAIPLTNLCVYKQASASINTFDIYDMENNQVLDTFTLPDDGYTIDGVAGWGNIIYVKVTLNSVSSTSTFAYDISSTSLVHMVGKWNSGMNYETSSTTHQIDAVDDCMICGISDGKCWICKASDPYNPISLTNISNSLRDSYSNERKISQLKYTADGKHLLLSSFNRVFSPIFDVGYVINNGPLTDYPIYRMDGYYVNGINCAGINTFDNGIIRAWKDNNNVCHCTWYPLSVYLPHKVTGDTTTIQAYNNPKYVYGKTLTIKLTNDVSS